MIKIYEFRLINIYALEQEQKLEYSFDLWGVARVHLT